MMLLRCFMTTDVIVTGHSHMFLGVQDGGMLETEGNLTQLHRLVEELSKDGDQLVNTGSQE